MKYWGIGQRLVRRDSCRVAQLLISEFIIIKVSLLNLSFETLAGGRAYVQLIVHTSRGKKNEKRMSLETNCRVQQATIKEKSRPGEALVLFPEFVPSAMSLHNLAEFVVKYVDKPGRVAKSHRYCRCI